MSTRRYKVIEGPVGIRQEPDGFRTTLRLSQGAEFTSDSEPVDKAGYLWVKHAQGWSALQESDGDEIFIIDISDLPADRPRKFRVSAPSISIRATANGVRLPAKLYYNNEISADPASRVELGGYVWWKHDKGWSAECSLNGKEIFMKEVFDLPAPSAKPAQKAPLPEHLKGKVALQVAQVTKVRGKPSTDPRGMVIVNLKPGKVLEVDMDTLVEADGYYWVKHAQGWSAIQSIDGKTRFLAEAGSIAGMIAIGAEGPKAQDLPHYRALVTQLPVALTDIQWFQYFGNNMWAYTEGKKYGYDRYSQGLHGGLDFGNSQRAGIKVVAGVEAQYVKTDFSRKNNGKIILQNGHYQFIYQHITNPRSFAPNQIIKADTVLGDIEHHSIDNGWDHLHFEVRFMDEWIINPLLLMTEAVYNSLIGRFNPAKPNTSYTKTDSTLNCFYQSARWSKWTTPLEQPMIKLAGQCVGPRFQDSDKPYDDDASPTAN